MEKNYSEPSPNRLRVLVVDDDPPSAKTLGWIVEMFGHEVRLAHSGKEAFEAARAYRPHAVLLDIGLSDMSGYDLCAAMRKEAAFTKTVIIAQTGWGLPEHKERSAAAGFDHHLVKPVDMQQLEEILGAIPVTPAP